MQRNRPDCERTVGTLLHTFWETLTATGDAAIYLSGVLCQEKEAGSI